MAARDAAGTGDGKEGIGAPMTAVLAVDYGWQGMRELSLALSRLGLPVDVLIKGRVEPDVLAIITRPANMRILVVGRLWFRLRLLGHCLAARAHDRLVVVIQWRETSSQRRTRRWVEWLQRVAPLTLYLFQESKQGNRLLRQDGTPVSPESLAQA